MDSSEAVLTGRRQPFRLAVIAVETATGNRGLIRPLVSEEFVVRTLGCS